MTVDLTKLKAGVIINCKMMLRYDYNPEHDYVHVAALQERAGLTAKTILLSDILEIIPAPFDWSKVKQGDAFESEEGIVYFVAKDWADKSMVVVGSKICNFTKPEAKHLLKPRPELNLF